MNVSGDFEGIPVNASGSATLPSAPDMNQRTSSSNTVDAYNPLKNGWDAFNPAAKGHLLPELNKSLQQPMQTGYTIDPNAFNAQNAWDAARGSQGFFGNGQMNLAQALTAQMNGGGPNLANEQLKAGTDRNLANAAALQASGRGGGNPALQARNVAGAQAGIAQQAAGQAAQNRLAQQLAAQQQLGSVLGEGRGEELQQGQQYLQGQEAGQQLGSQNSLGLGTINAGISAQNNKNTAGLIGAGGNFIAGLFEDGGVVPGEDSGHDDKLVGARGQEVYINPENPLYPAARASVATENGSPIAKYDPRTGGTGARMQAHAQAGATGSPLARRILDWISNRNMTGAATGQPYATGVGG